MRYFIIIVVFSFFLTLCACHSAKQVVDAPGVEMAAPEKTDSTATKTKRTRRPPYRQQPQTTNMEELTKRATAGDTAAQTELGIVYLKGDVVERDVEKAVEWWTKAADAGSTIAQYKMGICHHFGFGTRRNLKKARYYYEQAAEKGYKPAKVALTTLEKEEE